LQWKTASLCHPCGVLRCKVVTEKQKRSPDSGAALGPSIRI
jgi:hypothetical protein